MKLQKDNKGVAPVIIVVLIVAVLAVVGFVGFRVMNKDKGSSVGDAVKQAVTKCTYSDKDLCKFITNFKANKYYTVKTTSTSEGKTTTMTMQYVAPDKTYLKMDGEGSYEIISIDKTTYTKAGNTWYKQTIKTDTSNTDTKVDFDEPKDDTTAQETYKSLGKEACGNLTCFKYEVIDKNNTTTKEFIWFDTKDYQLRKTRSESTNGEVSESTFSYDKVTINEPSPVKDLKEGEYIIPGATEPTSLPTGVDPSLLNQ